jgi:hypothetical protein
MLSLDHALIFVHDLDQAAARYRRLGFTLTPRGAHPSLGTANHTVMLARDYLELITVLVPGPTNERWASILARGDGFGAVALGTRDAVATRDQLRHRGFDIPPAVDFARPVATPDGEAAARFTVAHLPGEATPALPAFFCQHHTPGLVWIPDYQSHPNTAFVVAGLIVVHPDPAGVGPTYERLLGRASVHPHPGGLELDLRGTRLMLVTPRFAAARLGRAVTRQADEIRPIGITIGVRSLPTCRAVLTANRVPSRPFGRASVLVEPDHTSGVFLEFLAI